MKYPVKICCPILNLEIDKLIPIQSNFLLSRFRSPLSNFLGEDYVKQFELQMGKYLSNMLQHDYYFATYFEKEFENEKDKKIFINQVSLQALSILQGISICLWFVKDNSVNVYMALVGSKNLGLLRYDVSETSFYNSSGEKTNTQFSFDEIKKAYSYNEELNKILTKKKFKNHSLDKEGVHSRPNPFNDIDLKKQHRIDGAFEFLRIARESDFVPHKIFCYMSIFEALFTINNKDIAKCISRRVCMYLDKKGNSKKELAKILMDGYDIRSRFVHGDLKDYTSAEILQVSSAIDEVLRTIWIKILENDSEIFIRPKEEFEQWINNLWSNENSDLPK